MKANQKQNPEKLKAAENIAQEMWKLLGEKTRHVDQLNDWAQYIMDDWDDPAYEPLTPGRTMEIMRWAVTENEFTVANLRIAKDPGQSLFVRQWENVQIFYESAAAVKKAQERKKWKYGACAKCDEEQAEHSKGGWCWKCNQRSSKISKLVEKALEKSMVAVSEKLWWMLDRQFDTPNAQVIVQGEHLGEKGAGAVSNFAHKALMDDTFATDQLADVLGWGRPEWK